MALVTSRYSFLRGLIWLYRLGAFLVFLITLVFVLLNYLVTSQITTTLPGAGMFAPLGLATSFLIFVSGTVAAIWIATIGETVRVVIDIEENTRATAESVYEAVQALQQAQQMSSRLQDIPQNIRFVVDDMQRLNQTIQDIAHEQRQIAADTATIKRKVAPTS